MIFIYKRVEEPEKVRNSKYLKHIQYSVTDWIYTNFDMFADLDIQEMLTFPEIKTQQSPLALCFITSS